MICNRKIVLTGASSGIGKSMLEMLSAPENNNRIIAASRSIGKLTGFGDNVTLFPCDLSTREGVDELFAKDGVELETGEVYYRCQDGVTTKKPGGT